MQKEEETVIVGNVVSVLLSKESQRVFCGVDNNSRQEEEERRG